MAKQKNGEIIMDGFTMEDLLEEVQMQKELQEGRNERRRAFEIRADVLAFLAKKKYSNHIEARFDNDWLYSNDLPDGLDIPAKDWPIARRLIKLLKNRDFAEYWLAEGETPLTKPKFTGIPTNIIFDEREKHENRSPIKPTPPRISMDEIDDLDLYAARRLKYKKATITDKQRENGLQVAGSTTTSLVRSASDINGHTEYHRNNKSKDEDLRGAGNSINNLKETISQLNESTGYRQKALTTGPGSEMNKKKDSKSGLGFKTDILKVHSLTENCDTVLEDLESLLEDFPPYLPPDTTVDKVDIGLKESTKVYAGKSAVEKMKNTTDCKVARGQKELSDNQTLKTEADKEREFEDTMDRYLDETLTDDTKTPPKRAATKRVEPEDTNDYKIDRGLKESKKFPARKTADERREELEELDSILRETEHLSKSLYTTHSDDTVEKRFKHDTPWADELVTAHSSGQLATAKSFGDKDSGRELFRRPYVPVDGRSKIVTSKKHRKGESRLPQRSDIQANPDEVPDKVYNEISVGTSHDHRMGAADEEKDKEVGEIQSGKRKKRGKKKKRQYGSKSDKDVPDENQACTGVGNVDDRDKSSNRIDRKGHENAPEASNERGFEVNNKEADKKSSRREFKASPWELKKARQKALVEPKRNKNTDANSRDRTRGRETPVTERVSRSMLFPQPEPVGIAPPRSLRRPQLSLKRRIFNSVGNGLDVIKSKVNSLCCCQ